MSNEIHKALERLNASTIEGLTPRALEYLRALIEKAQANPEKYVVRGVSVRCTEIEPDLYGPAPAVESPEYSPWLFKWQKDMRPLKIAMRAMCGNRCKVSTERSKPHHPYKIRMKAPS